MLAAVLDLLAPARCPGCTRRGRLPWCAACAPDPLAADGCCPRCGAPVARAVPPDGGPSCPLRGSDVEAVVAAHDYRGVVATVVRGAKLSGWTAAYPGLAGELAAALAQRDWPCPDAVTGVPVPAPRRRRRGFDHAALLARHVAADLHVPFVDLARVEAGAVDRGASGRATARVGTVTARGRVPSRVLVVDDVITTGATARTVATALRRGGATRVRVAAIARAGGHGARPGGSGSIPPSSG